MGIAVVAAIALLAVGLAQTRRGGSVLRDAGATSTPARYTELAFAQPTQLPAQLFLPVSSVRIPFTLHNVGSAPRRYAWSVTSSGAGPAPVAEGSALAAPGQNLRVRPHVRLSCQGQRVRVAVRVADPRLSIGFWARCPAPQGASPSA